MYTSVLPEEMGNTNRTNGDCMRTKPRDVIFIMLLREGDENHADFTVLYPRKGLYKMDQDYTKFSCHDPSK